jgi:hypothetical protein
VFVVIQSEQDRGTNAKDNAQKLKNINFGRLRKTAKKHGAAKRYQTNDPGRHPKRYTTKTRAQYDRTRRQI